MDEVDRAQWELNEALATWSHEGFHRQHYNALISQANIAIYTEDPVSAWNLVEEKWKALEGSLLLRIQVLRTDRRGNPRDRQERGAVTGSVTGAAPPRGRAHPRQRTGRAGPR